MYLFTFIFITIIRRNNKKRVLGFKESIEKRLIIISKIKMKNNEMRYTKE